MGGTTYYFNPDDNSLEGVNGAVEETSKASAQSMSGSRDMQHSPTHGSGHSSSSQQPFSVYAGPPSYLQNLISHQRPSFFVNEELRLDLIQRNSLTLATVDPALFPGNGSLSNKGTLC